MEIYIINMLSLLIWKIFYQKSNFHKRFLNKLIVIGICCQFSLIQGLRSVNVGSDTLKYVSYYETICNGGYSYLDMITAPPFNFEVGWLWLMKFLSDLNFSSRGFLIVVSLLINILFSVFIYRKSQDIVFSYWIFVGIEYFTLSFTMLRQMIAIGMVLVSFTYYKKNMWKLLVFAFIAITFHITAITYLIILVIMFLIEKNREKLNFRFLIGSIVVTYMFVILFGKIILKLVTKVFYSYYHISSYDLGMLWFVMIGILVLLLGVYLFKVRNDEEVELEIYHYILMIFVASVFQYTSTFMILLSRVALYYYAFTIIILPNIAIQIPDFKLRRFLSVAVYTLTFMQYILFSMDIYNLVPYSLGW